MRFELGRARLGSVSAYAAAAVCLCLITGLAALKALNVVLEAASRPEHVDAAAQSGSTATPRSKQSSSGRVILTQDDWIERIQRKDYWEGRGGTGSGPSRPNGARASAPPEKPSRLGTDGAASLDQFPPVSTRDASRGFSSGADWDGTYRTVCVRLCDGYFFPVSFSTTEDNFERDQARCEASCSSPARLFVFKNPGEEIEEMRDIEGVPYTRLKTAFQFRQKYDGACKCTPHPWEQQALERHRLYALEATGKKGDREAAKVAAELRTKLDSDDRRQKRQTKAGRVQSAVATAGSEVDEQHLSARAQRGKKKRSDPATNAAKDPSSGARSPDLMRIGTARPSNQIRNSGGKPTSASRALTGARQQPWQALVFENR